MLKKIYIFIFKIYEYIKSCYIYVCNIKRFIHKDRRTIEKKYEYYLDKINIYVEENTKRFEEVKFSNTCLKDSIYAKTYLLLLLLDLDFPIESKEIQNLWREIDDSQCKDGLFYDINALNYQFIIGDHFGARHLLPHIIIAYTKIGKTPKYRFSYLDFLQNSDVAVDFISTLGWDKPWGASNVVMNYVVAMQYARDYMKDERFTQSIKAIENWLVKNINPQMGMWLFKRKITKSDKYEAVRAAYHIYPILKYDGIDIPYAEKAIDIILELQNNMGGYDYKLNSGACEDIDAIDSLIRLSAQTEYKKEDVKKCIKNSINWVLKNQMDDGGFVFSIGEKFNYGHINLSSERNESNLFATWFRNLSLMYMFDYLGIVDNHFQKIPGMELDYRQR